MEIRKAGFQTDSKVLYHRREYMIFEPDDKLKQKMTKNGSVLQYMYSVSGAGKGIMAMGTCWLSSAPPWRLC